MIDFSVTVLGCGSAVPTRTTNPSAQLVSYRNKQFLIDCGEGTQMRMIKYNVRHRKLNHVFISHLHGDHFFGLIGLLSTYHLIGRRSALHVYAPLILQSLIEHHFQVTATALSFPLIFHALEDYAETNLFEDDYLFVKAFPLKHSTPTWGFLIKEKDKKRRINKSFIEQYKPGVEEISEILKGKDYVTEKGILLKNKAITNDPVRSRSYAYCSDTVYEPSIVDSISGVDLLYHEATFDNSMQEKAHEWLHSTAAEAALIAKQAKANKLLIGHFSNRHNHFQLLLEEAKAVFENTHICQEGQTYELT
jgi:ribonuclease Z